MIVRTRRDRSEKLREDQYREGYTNLLGGGEKEMEIISSICGSR